MTLRLLPVVALALAMSAFATQQPPPPPPVDTGVQTSPVETASAADAAPAASLQGSPDTAGAAAAARPDASGLPRREPEPRTMKAQWPVFALLAVSWVGIVGYLLVIGRQSRRIADLADRAGRSA